MLWSALPMMAAQFLSLLYSIVDRIYIGALPDVSVAALAGIGLCFPIVSLITGFANLFGSGGAPLCSIARGSRDLNRAAQIMNMSFYMTLLAGILLTLVIYVLADPLLLLFGASGSTLPYASAYLKLYILGTVPAMLTLAMNPFIQSQGFSSVSMVSVALGALVNIALDPVFIFVLKMGVRGAALATILSQFLSCLCTLHFLRSKKAELHLSAFRAVVWKIRIVQDILSLGLASFIMSATNSLVQIACNSQLAQAGSDIYVSIMTVISSVRQILDTPILALADGTSPVLGYNYGAGNPAGVKKGIIYMTLTGLLYTALVWVLILLFPQIFVGIFNRQPDFIATAVPCMRVYFAAFLFQALQYAGQSVFKSLNRKKQAIFFSLLRKVIIVLPLTYLLPLIPALGVMGVFLAEPISNVIGGSACFITMMRTIYRRLSSSSTRPQPVRQA